MTHLKIQQKNVSEGGSVENVSGQLLSALYALSKDENLVYDSTDLKGDLLVGATYQKYITELHTQYPGLNITALSYYLFFEDKVIESYWANSEYGDGIGISTTSAQSVSTWPRRNTEYNTMGLSNPSASNEYSGGKFAFLSDPTITSFDELGQFTNITHIPGACFRKSSLLSIDLSNITKIGSAAFRECPLTGVIDIPNLTTFEGRNWNVADYNEGGGLFRLCQNITEVNMSSNILPSLRVEELPDYLFYLDISLKKVTGLENVSRIKQNAFKGCSSLESLDLTNKVTRIDEAAFADSSIVCADLTNVNTIGVTAFYNTTLRSTSTWDSTLIDSLATSITINALTIGQLGFEKVRFSPSVISVPNITSMGNGAFLNTNISQANIANLLTLPYGAFLNCSNLTKVTGLSSCTTIGQFAFRSCSNLNDVDINWNNITSIAREAFNICSMLPIQNISIPNLTTIGSGAFSGCKLITTVSNLGQITELPGSVFRDCNCITSVSLPSSLRKLECDAFYNTSIETIIGPEGLTYMCFGQMKFANNAFKYVEVPSTVTDMARFFHRSLEGQSGNFAVCVIKATTPPTLGVYNLSGGGVTYDMSVSGAITTSSNNGAKTFLGIYVPDTSLNAYLSAPAAWQLSEILARLKPISQLQTDSPSNWAIYQAGLSS